MRYWMLVFLLLLVACEEVPLEDGSGRIPSQQPTDGRPTIPRVNPPEDAPETPVVNTTPPRVIILVPNGTPGTALDVPIGDAIGKHHPVITQAQFRLLKHPVIRVHNNRVIGYEETLGFYFKENSTGKVIFGEDEDAEQIGSFLRFEEGKPIFEYRLELDSGTFESIQGRDIQILGHTYVIAEASNKSVTLYGKSVASNLLFENGAKLRVNSSSRSALSRVTPYSISFVLFAEGDDDGGILLSPGESLVDNIGWEDMGSDLFDIRYKGAPVLESNAIRIDRTGFGYKMSIDARGGELSIPLVDREAGRILLGENDERLHVSSCGFCIAPGDHILLSGPDGRTYYVQYRTTTDDHVIFRDEMNNRYNYEYDEKLLKTDLVLGNARFRVRVSDENVSERNISIEGLKSEIILEDGAILRFGTLTNTTLPLQLVMPAAVASDHREHKALFNLSYDDDWRIDVGNTTFIEDDEDAIGMDSYGILFYLKRDDDGLALNRAEEIVIYAPREQAYGTIALEE